MPIPSVVRLAGGLLCLCASASVLAHVSLEVPQAKAGSYYKAVLRLTHGCQGSPIRQVVVQIPRGVQGAKPMPKPGWQIEIEKVKLDQPYRSHGKTVTEEVAQIRWTGGPLADGFFDEFVLLARLPDSAGTLWWKVSQVCENGRIDWSDVPAEGKTAADYEAPAARLEVLPAAQDEHRH